MKKINIKGVSQDTWARTILLVLALVISFIQWYKNGGDIYEGTVSVFTSLIYIYGFWKNNSFTELAQIADEARQRYDETGAGSAVVQRLIYPLKNMRITQAYSGIINGEKYSHYAHSHSTDYIDYSLDDGEHDKGNNDYFYAPCDLKITHIYISGTNTFWWESLNKVKLANGKMSKVCGYVIHCPDSSLKNLKVGQIFKQGEKIAQEGTEGATGYHFHFAIALGSVKCVSGAVRPWIKNKAGAYVLTSTDGAIKPEEAMFVNTKFTNIISAAGLKWIKTTENTYEDNAKNYFETGDKGPGVYMLKQCLILLKKKGIITQSVDDNDAFGAGTEKAVKQVQTAARIEPDGKAGPITMRAIRTLLGG